MCTGTCSHMGSKVQPVSLPVVEYVGSYLEDLILVGFKGMEFHFQVTQVPQSNSLEGGTPKLTYVCVCVCDRYM